MPDATTQRTSLTTTPQLTPASALEVGRDAFAKRAWKEAYAQLSAADRATRLEVADLARLAGAAHLVGQWTVSENAWDRAHHAAAEAGDVPGAARAAFWLSFGLLVRRNIGQAAGWTARATRLLDAGNYDCVERGYLRFTEALRHGMEEDAENAERLFGEAGSIGARFGDNDLVALSRHGLGRTLIFAGDTARGATLMDETLVALVSGDVSPLFVGDIYCSAIASCNDMFDLGRAREWTEALKQWCDTQPDAIPYRGHCLVNRAEIIRMSGEWSVAESEALRAREWFEQTPASGVGGSGIGSAWYQIGEVHRVRGAFSEADDAFHAAARAGRDPQPGLALLRLAQGQLSAAESCIRRAVGEARMWPIRSRLLPAFVEIALASNDLVSAKQAAHELSEIAGRISTPVLAAYAASASAAVALAGGDALSALTSLRAATATWRTLRAPYQTARARVLTGLACRALGDTDAADAELEAACEVFEQLGAKPDIARVNELLRGPRRENSTLTLREIEVVRLIATGKTNRVIAAALCISEKTVARHVSNIFTKLGVSNRAAATAYAHEHGLMARRT